MAEEDKKQNNSLSKENISRPYKGLHTDNSPQDQPEGTYSYALNARLGSLKGDSNKLSREESSEVSPYTLPEGSFLIGSCYLKDDVYAIFLIVTGENPTNEIGLIDFKTGKYETHVRHSDLNFSFEHPIDATYRLRRGGQRCVYFTDNYNRPRQFNFDDIDEYKSYSGNRPLDFEDIDKYWNTEKFNLVKTFSSVPKYTSIEVVEGGSLNPGSYNVGGIQYLDEDFNPTEWILPSETVIVFNDSINKNSFQDVRGSTNKKSAYQNFTQTSKAIKVELENLDQDTFLYYRLAFVEASNGTGEINKIVYTEALSTKVNVFTYDGTNATIAGTLEELSFFSNDIKKAKHIQQIENRLILANVESSDIKYERLQKYASKIKSNLEIREVILNDIKNTSNPKNPAIHNFINGDEEQSLGYMPGEIYSFGIVYIFKSGVTSPVFHIPGANPNESTLMSTNNTCQDFQYLNTGDCKQSGYSYWGKDSYGDNLEGSNIRHHRFPTRKELHDSNDPSLDGLDFSFSFNQTSPENEYSPYVNADSGLGAVDNPLIVTVQADGYEEEELYIVYPDEFPYSLDYFPYSEDPTNITLVSATQNNGDPLPSPVVSIQYDTTTIDKPTGLTKANILGINFSEIEIPSKDIVGEEIIGYYIVQNRRNENTKTILDTGLLLPVIKEDGDNFEAVGMLSPNTKTSGYGSNTNSDYMEYSEDKFAIFHPENAFNLREYTSATLEFNQTINSNYNVKLQSSKTQDCQPGTSYNPDRHAQKERDTDGYTLHCLTRRKSMGAPYNSSFGFSTNPILDNLLNDVSSIDYLNPLNSFSKETGSNLKEIFNLSSDTRFAVASTSSTHPTAVRELSEGPAVPLLNVLNVVNIKRELRNPYSNFRVLPYYRASKNIVDPSEDSISIFAGDSYISSLCLTSTIFSNIKLKKRAGKEKSWWKIALGVVGTVAGVILSFTGVGAVIGVGLTAMSIGLLVKGASDVIEVDKMNRIYNELYEQGLRNTVYDEAVDDYFGAEIDQEDDEIQWFSDVIPNIYLESGVNMNWRVGSTGEVPDFAKAPGTQNMDYYLDRMLDKLTVLDSENDSGRLYQGYCNLEIYEVNKDYERREAQKPFFHLPIEYDVCDPNNERYFHRVVYSEQSFQEELTDNYRSFLPLSYRDIEGETGEITALSRIGSNLYIFTEEALWHLPQNFQERVTGDILSFIGTGEFFNIPPKKILDSDFGLSAGTQHKHSMTKTPYGVFFVSNRQQGVFLFNGNKLEPLHLKGMNRWFKNNLNLNVEKFFLEKGFQQEYPYSDNPFNPIGVGYITGYDPLNERIFLTKVDYLKIEDALQEEDVEELFLTRDPNTGDYKYLLDPVGYVESQNPGADVSYNKRVLGGFLSDIVNSEEPYYESINTQPTSIFDTTKLVKSWFTITYNLASSSWVSFMSYNPSFYFTTKKGLWSFDNNLFYKHGIKGSYGTYNGVSGSYIIELIQISNPLIEKLWDYIKIVCQSEVLDEVNSEYYDVEKFFNKAIISTEKDSVGEKVLVNKNNLKSGPTSWFMPNESTLTSSEISVVRQGSTWNINSLRNIRVDYSNSLWVSTDKNNGEKLLNTSVLDTDLDWQQKTPLKGRYLIARLIFDNFDEDSNKVNLLLDYTITTETSSIR